MKERERWLCNTIATPQQRLAQLANQPALSSGPREVRRLARAGLGMGWLAGYMPLSLQPSSTRSYLPLPPKHNLGCPTVRDDVGFEVCQHFLTLFLCRVGASNPADDYPILQGWMGATPGQLDQLLPKPQLPVG